MHIDYSDITDRIGQAPLWYDENGVPRFEPFAPQNAGIYSKYVAYLHIACQDCGARFYVSRTTQIYDMGVDFPDKAIAQDPNLSPWEAIGSFHYGDPPNHGCVGDTMNCIPIAILGFWENVLLTKPGELGGMQPRPDLVFEIPAGRKMMEEIANGRITDAG